MLPFRCQMFGHTQQQPLRNVWPAWPRRNPVSWPQQLSVSSERGSHVGIQSKGRRLLYSAKQRSENERRTGNQQCASALRRSDAIDKATQTTTVPTRGKSSSHGTPSYITVSPSTKVCLPTEISSVVPVERRQGWLPAHTRMRF